MNHGFILFCFLLLQIGFWYGVKLPAEHGEEPKKVWAGLRTIKPDLGVVPDLPTADAVKAFSFGDEEFYFRRAAYSIQNAGDTFGRTTSLKDYDYAKLYEWWMILDSLDDKSDYVPSMVGYYFAASQNVEEHVPYVVTYLEQHADRDPENKWLWYSQAVYNAKHKLKDLDLALRIAKKLSAAAINNPDVPIWAAQMPAFIMEDQGDLVESCDFVGNMLFNTDPNRLSDGEWKFMLHFIRDRLIAMVDSGEGEIDPRCGKLLEIEQIRNLLGITAEGKKA